MLNKNLVSKYSPIWFYCDGHVHNHFFVVIIENSYAAVAVSRVLEFMSKY